MSHTPAAPSRVAAAVDEVLKSQGASLRDVILDWADHYTPATKATELLNERLPETLHVHPMTLRRWTEHYVAERERADVA